MPHELTHQQYNCTKLAALILDFCRKREILSTMESGNLTQQKKVVMFHATYAEMTVRNLFGTVSTAFMDFRGNFNTFAAQIAAWCIWNPRITSVDNFIPKIMPASGKK